MNMITSRQVLARFGLERRPTASRTALTFGSVLGLGAALGAGALWASRQPRVRRLFRRGPKLVQSMGLSRPHAAGA